MNNFYYNRLRQDVINKVYDDWSNTWQLLCQHCHISFSPRPQPFNYFVSDFNLHMVSTARDLGVLIDRRLTFRDHVK